MIDFLICLLSNFVFLTMSSLYFTFFQTYLMYQKKSGLVKFLASYCMFNLIIGIIMNVVVFSILSNIATFVIFVILGFVFTVMLIVSINKRKVTLQHYYDFYETKNLSIKNYKKIKKSISRELEILKRNNIHVKKIIRNKETPTLILVNDELYYILSIEKMEIVNSLSKEEAINSVKANLKTIRGFKNSTITKDDGFKIYLDTEFMDTSTCNVSISIEKEQSSGNIAVIHKKVLRRKIVSSH